MKLYSVTVEYEDEREGQWVETYAVLAHDPHSAGECAQAHVEDNQLVADRMRVTVNGEAGGDIRPRVVATLLPDLTSTSFHWRDIR